MQPELQRTRGALTLRYGLLVSTLLAVFALAVYGQVSRLRGEQTRRQMERLAITAAGELPLLHHEHQEMQRRDVPAWLREQAQGALTAAPVAEDQHVRIRWYDEHLVELKAAGGYRPSDLALPPAALRQQRQWWTLRDGLAHWRPVPAAGPTMAGAPRPLEGYVSVALAAAASEGELERLRQGLWLGAAGAGLVGFLASHWMVSASLQPIRRQIERLIRFTADASHELRHPLTAIRALIGTLRHGGLLEQCPEPVARKLALIEESSARMGRLLDDLLLLSRSDRAIAVSTAMTDFPLEELLEDLVSLHRAEAEAAGLRLEAQLNGTARVHGDPDRLRRLLENLLSNALRFSPAGGCISLGLARQRERVLVWVDDEGPGIPPEQRRQVFERFWQADPARSGADHHGLGLAIAQAIAAEHRGTLSAGEAPGGGCRMLLELPLRS